MEHYAAPLEVGEFETKKHDETGAELGTFAGYASAYSLDLGKDIVQPGAFKGAEPSKVPLLWQHDQTMPVGRILSLSEDSHGLHFKAALVLGVQKAREAYELLRAGVIRATSIGYRVKPGGAARVSVVDPTTGKKVIARKLSSLMLGEISLVTSPMQPEALIDSSSIKSAEADADIVTWRDVYNDLVWADAMRDLGRAGGDAYARRRRRYR